MRAYINCVGCEQRQLDTQKIINYCRANGMELVDSPLLCDYAVIVTCAVDTRSEEASLAMVKNVSSQLPTSARLIVGGCFPSISPSKLTGIDVYHTFSPREMDNLDNVFGNVVVSISGIEYPTQSIFDRNDSRDSGELTPRQEYEMAKNGYKIRIDQGCLSGCSYCMIRKATGKLASEPLESVVAQLERGVSQGEKTIMLMGGDTGAYGIDIGTTFHALLRKMLSVNGDYQLFIHDFNVHWLIRGIDQYAEVFQLNEQCRRIRAVNFPVQSGSDRILKLMRRPYKAEAAIAGLVSVKQHSPAINIGTHIMVGFPSETEKDFDDTLRLLEAVDFDFVTCFAYSEHEMADSARIPDKVGRDTVERRMDRIAELLNTKVKIIR